jgi:hypothetical protein
MYSLSTAADLAAKRLEESEDKSKLAFYRITEQAVRGCGITNPSILHARVKDVRAELRRRSAQKRRAIAATKQIMKRMAS